MRLLVAVLYPLFGCWYFEFPEWKTFLVLGVLKIYLIVTVYYLEKERGQNHLTWTLISAAIHPLFYIFLLKLFPQVIKGKIEESRKSQHEERINRMIEKAKEKRKNKFAP